MLALFVMGLTLVALAQMPAVEMPKTA